MTHETPDPPRLSDANGNDETKSGNGDGLEALRKLMAKRREGPSPAAVDRMSERLTAAGVLGAPSTTANLRTTAKIRYFKLGALVVMATGTWQLARHLPTSSTESKRPTAPFAASASARTPAPMPALTQAESRDTEAPAPPAPTDSIPVERLPRATDGARFVVSSADHSSADHLTEASEKGSENGHRSAPLPSVGESTVPPRGILRVPATELELIQRAQETLAVAPARSLAFVESHARNFPRGQFVQEREVLAVEALARLGRGDEARERARALVRPFTRTPYATRLATAVGPSALSPSNDPLGNREAP